MCKRQVLVSAVCGLLLGLIAVPALARTDEVGIDSPPIFAAKALYHDANLDGVNQPEELVGSYDVYDVQRHFSFHWSTVPGATFYRVSLIQYPPPGKGGADPGRE